MATRMLPSLVVVTVAAGLLLTGCGQDPSGEDGVIRQQAVRLPDPAGSDPPPATVRNLPIRRSGPALLDGSAGPLTAAAVRDYAVRTGSEPARETGGEERAFARLCAGEVDIVDSARPISREEWEACQANDLDVVQVQVGADAVVPAIRSETDVGGDCLTTDQVREVFRAGSPVTSWSAVGLDDVPLKTGGPAADDSAFEFFGRYVLGAPEPALTNVRSDYRAFEEDDRLREWVVGSENDKRLADHFDRVAARHQQLKSDLKVAWQVWHDANDEVLEAVRQQRKGIRDERSPAERKKDDERVSRAYFARSDALVARKEIKVRFDEVRDRYRQVRDARRRYDATLGKIAYFRFGYYGVYEQFLRPFEVTPADGERNCVFPSQQTIVSGEYPLARQVLLTTTTRALERAEVRNFLAFFVARSQRLADGAGIVALPDAQVDEQLGWLEGEEEPRILAPAADGTTRAPTVPVQEPAPPPVR